jgi:hypothetical protein
VDVGRQSKDFGEITQRRVVLRQRRSQACASDEDDVSTGRSAPRDGEDIAGSQISFAM